jgi:hypothetical protein
MTKVSKKVLKKADANGFCGLSLKALTSAHRGRDEQIFEPIVPVDKTVEFMSW